DGAPGNWPPHSGTSHRRTGGGRGRGSGSAAGRQSDARHPEPACGAQVGAATTRAGSRSGTGDRGTAMPKWKKNRGRGRRVKKTGTGKIMRAKAFKRHILTSKTTKSKRHMRGTEQVSDADAAKLERMLPYK